MQICFEKIIVYLTHSKEYPKSIVRKLGHTPSGVKIEFPEK